MKSSDFLQCAIRALTPDQNGEATVLAGVYDLEFYLDHWDELKADIQANLAVGDHKTGTVYEGGLAVDRILLDLKIVYKFPETKL